MKYVGCILFLALLTNPLAANQITPVDAKATTTYGSEIMPLNLIDGRGLSDPHGTPGTTLDDLHDNDPNALTMWHAGCSAILPSTGLCNGNYVPRVDMQVIEFDLGGSFDLTATHVWQMNQGDPGSGPLMPDRGVNEMEVLVSAQSAGIAFDSLGTFSLAPALGTSLVSAEVLPLVGANDVRRVRFQINSAYADRDFEFVGLSEVRFEGTLVPEPSSIGLTIWLTIWLTRRLHRGQAV